MTAPAGKQGARTLFFSSAQPSAYRYGVRCPACGVLCRQRQFKRSMRGHAYRRLKDAAGNTTAHGDADFTLRQHIRREKANSPTFYCPRRGYRCRHSLWRLSWSGRSPRRIAESRIRTTPEYSRYSGGRSATEGKVRASCATSTPCVWSG